MSVLPGDFDVTDPDRLQAGVPMAELNALRRKAPVWWNRQPDDVGFDDGGFWLVTRHADVREVSLDAERFSSWENGVVPRFMPGATHSEVEMLRVMMINTDPPEHTKLRRMVNRGFTPRAMRMIEETLAERADAIVRRAASLGSGDFVTLVASELPLQAIAELLGIPQRDRGRIFEWSNQMIGYDDPETGVDPQLASTQLIDFAMALATERSAAPRDDIVTKLVTADVDDRGLTPDELGFFVLLLAIAGNETTRNAITHGMAAFFDFPDQWEIYRAERPDTAADEIVRWSTPVCLFQRTATLDTSLGGVEIGAGQRVGLSYSAANFDPEAFDAPERFDIRRWPNPQLGFGGGGPHYCLGANLAKLEINLMFNAIADHIPGVAPAGPVRRLRSGWVNGVKQMPVRFR